MSRRFYISDPRGRRFLTAFSIAYGKQVGAPYAASWSSKRSRARRFSSPNKAYAIAAALHFPCGSVPLMVHVARNQHVCHNCGERFTPATAGQDACKSCLPERALCASKGGR